MGRTTTACARCTRAGMRSIRARIDSRSKSNPLPHWGSRGESQCGEGGVLACSCASSALLWSAALLTQEALELLCQLFTADGSFGPSRRPLGLLGGTAGLTFQVFDMGRNLGVFGNGLSHPGVKIPCLFLHLRQKRWQADNLQTTAHHGKYALGVGPRRNIVRHVRPDACRAQLLAAEGIL